MNKIRKELESKLNIEYIEFQSKLIPNIDKKKILGIKTDVLKEMAKNIDGEEFIKDLPHYYFEENQLHAFIISSMKDENKCLELIDEFLPYVDNWATCDQMIPKIFKKNRNILIMHILEWINSNYPYAKRFGISMLMKFFLDNKYFDPKYLDLVSNIESDEYYVNMMIAWYFCEALIKQYDSAIIYIEEHKLNKWIHNKTIQKCIESKRIEDIKKDYLRILFQQLI